MGKETSRHLHAALMLYHEAQAADLDYGCVEVSLQALGGTSHLVDLLCGNTTEDSSLLNIILRKGFKSSWIVSIPVNATGQDIETILEGNLPDLQPNSKGKLAGYLGLESYSDPDQSNHVIAILPRQYMSRNVRRRLQKQRAYLVIDTSIGGALPITTNGLATYAKQIMNKGGHFAIARLSN